MQKLRIVAALLVVGILTLLIATTVAANGVPVTLYLTWLPGITNWEKAQPASGSAIVSVSLGELKLEAESLPHLTNGQYEAWLVTEDMQQMVSMGRFNSDMVGHVRFESTREDLPAREYRFLLISVEPEPDTSEASSGQWAIGGVFPDTSLLVVTATPAGSGSASGTTAPAENATPVTPTPPPPQSLPVTGGAPATGLPGGLLALAALLMGGGIIWRKRRQSL
ncbi:MAG: hypothetical protein GXP41_11080 [Chloroflexi bacterium]|nr:hypothetical protein [Chloroflexota bacterium]